jgi:hypothetical protein
MEIKVNKSKHPISETYMCHDCVFVFTIHSKNSKGKKYLFCPCCGDQVSVREFVFEKKKRVKRRPWSDEEFQLIDRIISGELQKYQVATKVNRSYEAVQRKVEIRKMELKKKG